MTELDIAIADYAAKQKEVDRIYALQDILRESALVAREASSNAYDRIQEIIREKTKTAKADA